MEFKNTTAAIGSCDVVDLQVPENPTSFQTCMVSGSELNLNDVFLLLTVLLQLVLALFGILSHQMLSILQMFYSALGQL